MNFLDADELKVRLMIYSMAEKEFSVKEAIEEIDKTQQRFTDEINECGGIIIYPCGEDEVFSMKIRDFFLISRKNGGFSFCDSCKEFMKKQAHYITAFGGLVGCSNCGRIGLNKSNSFCPNCGCVMENRESKEEIEEMNGIDGLKSLDEIVELIESEGHTKFGLAYRNEYGHDFYGVPFVIELDSLEKCKNIKSDMEKCGYQDMIIFKIGKDAPEDITWEYVVNNKI